MGNVYEQWCMCCRGIVGLIKATAAVIITSAVFVKIQSFILSQTYSFSPARYNNKLSFATFLSLW